MFDCWGLRLPYLDAEHNTTRVNERAVELPIAAEWIARVPFQNRPTQRWEFGRVLDHYEARPPLWECVDLEETGDRVVNADLRLWAPERPLDAAVAISTLEHVGWDWDGSYQPQEAIRCLERLVGMLAEDGSMLVTIPMGAHPALDAEILDPVRPLGAVACTLVRDDTDETAPTWRQTPTPEWRPYIGGGRGCGSVAIIQFGVPLLPG